MVRFAKLEKDLFANDVKIEDYEMNSKDKSKVKEMIGKAQEVEKFEH